MHLVRQGVPTKLRPQEARVDPRGRGRATGGSRGSSQRRRQPGRGRSRDRLVVVDIHVNEFFSAGRFDERLLSAARILGPAATISRYRLLSAAETSTANQKRLVARHETVHRYQRRNWRSHGRPESTTGSPTPATVDSNLLQTKNRVTGTVEGAPGATGTREGTGTGTRKGTRQGTRGRGVASTQGTHPTTTPTTAETSSCETGIHHRGYNAPVERHRTGNIDEKYQMVVHCEFRRLEGDLKITRYGIDETP